MSRRPTAPVAPAYKFSLFFAPYLLDLLRRAEGDLMIIEDLSIFRSGRILNEITN